MTTLFDLPRDEALVAMMFPELDGPQASASYECCIAEPITPTRSDAEWEQAIEDAREEAARSVREECEARLRERIEIERSALAVACTSLQHARDRYFGEIEAEVVRLALGIAARVLHRETAMDPTLLAGIARHALAKLSDSEGAVLAVAPEGTDLWRTAMKATSIRVEEDRALDAGRVQLRATAGVAELGVTEQLVEIERGFFDLLARRPA